MIIKAHEQDLAAIGMMQMTVWEQAWYLRGMENLMVDMMTEDPIAEILLDKVTDIAVTRAESFTKKRSGCSFLGRRHRYAKKYYDERGVILHLVKTAACKSDLCRKSHQSECAHILSFLRFCNSAYPTAHFCRNRCA